MNRILRSRTSLVREIQHGEFAKVLTRGAVVTARAASSALGGDLWLVPPMIFC